MPARSLIDLLKPETREKLDKELVRRNFAGYREMVDVVNEQLASEGLELRVSKSALHRYGQDLEERLAALRRSTEVARTLSKEVGDDEGVMNDALMRLVQDKLFNLTLNMDLPEEVDIYKLGRVVAELGKASVLQKKHQIAIKSKAETVAQVVAEKAAQGGLSPEAVDAIRRDILGIADEG